MSPATPPMTPTASAASAAAITTDNETKRRYQPPQSRHPPSTSRDDCWSADETHALIDAWGSLHLSLNRGSLRQHQWSDVAAAVNSEETHPRRRRTDVQCKNRIDTLKKKYKIEKAKLAGDDTYVSPWPFFDRLDFLISGDKPSPVSAVETPAAVVVPARFPVKRRSAIRTRPARWLTEDRETEGGGGQREEEDDETGEGFEDGCRMLASAIRRVGEMYERVESMKQEQLIELEKHRLQFAKDLEFQRLKLLMDTHHQLLSTFKRSKLHHSHLDSYL